MNIVHTKGSEYPSLPFFTNNTSYFLGIVILGSKLMTKMPILQITQAYKENCFSGHSPIAQLPKINKFLKDQATDNAANAILILFAKILGITKQRILNMEVINKNLPGCP